MTPRLELTRSARPITSVLITLSLFCCSPAEDDEGDADGPPATAAGGQASGGGDGSESSGGVGSGGSSNATGGGGGGASGGSAGNPTQGRQLTVQVYSLRGDQKYLQLSVRDSTDLDVASPCDLTELGGCRLNDCPLISSNEAPIVRWYQGEETVTARITQETSEGVDVSTASLLLDLNDEPLIEQLIPPMAFRGEEQVQISLAGGVLPPIVHDTTMPLFLITTTPPSQTSDADEHLIEISASEGLTLTWERGVEGVSYHVLQPAYHEDGDRRYSLYREFDSTLGQGHIDASLLEHLPDGQLFKTVTARREEVEVEGGSYLFLLFDNTINPEKNRAIGLSLTQP